MKKIVTLCIFLCIPFLNAMDVPYVDEARKPKTSWLYTLGRGAVSVGSVATSTLIGYFCSKKVESKILKPTVLCAFACIGIPAASFIKKILFGDDNSHTILVLSDEESQQEQDFSLDPIAQFTFPSDFVLQQPLSPDEIENINSIISLIVTNRETIMPNIELFRALLSIESESVHDILNNGIVITYQQTITIQPYINNALTIPQTPPRGPHRQSLAFSPPRTLGDPEYHNEKIVFNSGSFWNWAEKGSFTEDFIKYGIGQRTIVSNDTFSIIITGNVSNNKFNGGGEVTIKGKDKDGIDCTLIFAGIFVNNLLKAGNNDKLTVKKNSGNECSLSLFRGILEIDFTNEELLSKFNTIYASLSTSDQKTIMIWGSSNAILMGEASGFYMGDIIIRGNWPTPQGNGKMFYAAGNWYEGQFYNGIQHGSGVSGFQEPQYYIHGELKTKAEYEEYKSRHSDEFPALDI